MSDKRENDHMLQFKRNIEKLTDAFLYEKTVTLKTKRVTITGSIKKLELHYYQSPSTGDKRHLNGSVTMEESIEISLLLVTDVNIIL